MPFFVQQQNYRKDFFLKKQELKLCMFTPAVVLPFSFSALLFSAESELFL